MWGYYSVLSKSKNNNIHIQQRTEYEPHRDKGLHIKVQSMSPTGTKDFTLKYSMIPTGTTHLQLPVGYDISPLKRVKFKILTTSRLHILNDLHIKLKTEQHEAH
jgi:hypothetical protein